MIRLWIGLPTICWLLIVSLAVGQTGGAGGDPAKPGDGHLVLDVVTEPPVAMYEDIEVFRRILDKELVAKTLALPPDGIHSVAFSPDGQRLAVEGTTVFGFDAVRIWDAASGKAMSSTAGHPGSATGSHPEGVYLEGRGIVYTLTLPANFLRPVGGSSKPAPKPLSQWDRVRNEVRGIKAKPDEAKAGREEPSLADTVLKLLADNGRHFSQLAQNEQLTVAITLRGIGNCAACHDLLRRTGGGAMGGKGGASSTGASAVPLWEFGKGGSPPPGPGDAQNPLGFFPPAQALVERGQSSTFGTSGGSDRIPEAVKTQAANFVQLGDNRLRQGRVQDAADAYQKATHLYGEWQQAKGAPSKRSTPPELTTMAEAYTKLAQARLMLGQRDEAFAILKKAEELLQPAKTPPAETSSAPAKEALPEKLIVAAPKSLLDQVGSGKISFEEFKKKATVQHLTFPSAKTMSNPGGGTERKQ